MPQNDACRVQPGHAANLRCFGVPELVGRPVGNPDSLARLGDGAVIGRDRVTVAWRPGTGTADPPTALPQVGLDRFLGEKR